MPTILKVANVHFTQTGNNRLEYTGNGVIRLTANGIQVPVGTTATRPTGEAGIIRFNTSTGRFEGHNASGWGAIGGEVDLSPANSYATQVGAGSNAYATQVGAAANARADTKLANTSGVSFAGNLFFPTGNVGIGKGTATCTLDVNGNIRARGGLPGANGYSFTSPGDTDSGMFSSADGTIEFYTDAVERMRITSLGRIGIGTTAPSHALHVVDTGFASGDFRAPVFYNSNDTNARFEVNKVVMRGQSPTVFFRDTDGNSAMLYNNSNFFYLLRGGNDTETTSQVGGQWPASFDLTNNNCLIGGNLSAIVNVIAYASDKRLKENIVEIPNALEKIRKIRGVTFDWKTDITEAQGFIPQTPTNDIGCIAQEVQEVLPHAVTLAPFDTWQPDPGTRHTPEELEAKRGTSKSGENYLTIQYERMVPLLIQAIKEQQEQIDAMKAELKALRK